MRVNGFAMTCVWLKPDRSVDNTRRCCTTTTPGFLHLIIVNLQYDCVSDFWVYVSARCDFVSDFWHNVRSDVTLHAFFGSM